MKITKLVHSCLLVETDEGTALFDPGIFSRKRLASKLDEINGLDYLIITHNHQDHLDGEIIVEIAKRWPKIKLAANGDITRQLKDLDLARANGSCVEFDAPHETLPMGGAPLNSGWHFGGLTHPGDSLSFSETKDVLALPYVAPWGSTTQAVILAKELNPKFIIPIHDWHLSDEARQWYLGLLERSFEQTGIKVVDTESGPAEL